MFDNKSFLFLTELTEEKYKGVIVIAEVNNKDKIEDVRYNSH